MAFERDLRVAEFSCREEPCAERLVEIGEAIEQFVSDHAEDIKRARSGWEDYAAHASKLGLTGAYESLIR